MNDPAPYPWHLDPNLAPAVWGGDELGRAYGKRGNVDDKLGESWECWDADAVTNGPLRGSSAVESRYVVGGVRASRCRRIPGRKFA